MYIEKVHFSPDSAAHPVQFLFLYAIFRLIFCKKNPLKMKDYRYGLNKDLYIHIPNFHLYTVQYVHYTCLTNIKVWHILRDKINWFQFLSMRICSRCIVIVGANTA
jgi:hypothetical protein